LERYRAGERAEGLAALLLMARGWRVVGRRVKTPLGEIDLIARRASVVAFVEVKKRDSLGEALEAITPYQRKRLMKAARWWLAAHPEHAAATCRFDMVAVNRWYVARHVSNVFDGD